VLRRHGYWVGLDGRSHHLAGRSAEDQHETAALRDAGLKYLDERFDHVKVSRTGGDTPADVARIVTTAFGRALDGVPPGKPFFLYFGFNQPHRTYKTPPAGAAEFQAGRLQLPPDYPDLPEIRTDYGSFLYTLHLMDRGFGALMEVLEKRKLAGNTLVVVMGDNGEALLRGKGTLYQRGTNVPLIVRWPGVVAPGTRSDILVSGEDIGPTILDAVGLDVPATMTGVSFAPALRGRTYRGREYVYTERGWHWGPITRTDGLDLSRAIISSRYKLIYNLLPDRAYVPVDMVKTAAWRAIVEAAESGRLSGRHRQLLFRLPRPIFELFDLETDPYELNNLHGREEVREIEMKLRIELSRWMVREADFLPMPLLDYPREN
jgi:arylsulfatase A-like enzyme